MKKILVSTDFTSASHNVAKYAAAFAKQADAILHLLHVYTEHPAPVEAPVAWDYVHGLKDQNYRILHKELDFLEKKYALEVHGEIRQGFKGDTITGVAEEIGADLIIVGSKNIRHNRLFGSTGLKLIRKSKIPVLIIPASYSFKPLKNFILAVDFREMAGSSCFEPLFSLIRKFDASLRVVHIEKKGSDMKSTEIAEKMQLDVILSKVSYVYNKIENDNILQGIHDVVESYPADCLAMVAHHHNIIDRIFGDVNTRSVSFNIHLPLLVLKNR